MPKLRNALKTISVSKTMGGRAPKDSIEDGGCGNLKIEGADFSPGTN